MKIADMSDSQLLDGSVRYVSMAWVKLAEMADENAEDLSEQTAADLGTAYGYVDSALVRLQQMAYRAGE